MKAFITSVALAGSLALSAGSALAASSAYCTQVANDYVRTYTHPVGAAVAGCAVGGILGNILSKGNGAATAGGCVVGGGAGLVISNEKRQQLFNQAYYDCMNSGGKPKNVYVQPVVAGPPPSGQAVVTQSVNVRVAGNKNAPIIGVLPAYTTVGVIQCTPGWCEVDVSGGPGWASRTYLSFQ